MLSERTRWVLKLPDLVFWVKRKVKRLRHSKRARCRFIVQAKQSAFKELFMDMEMWEVKWSKFHHSRVKQAKRNWRNWKIIKKSFFGLQLHQSYFGVLFGSATLWLNNEWRVEPVQVKFILFNIQIWPAKTLVVWSCIISIEVYGAWSILNAWISGARLAPTQAFYLITHIFLWIIEVTDKISLCKHCKIFKFTVVRKNPL